jgi:hypothetical protein
MSDNTCDIATLARILDTNEEELKALVIDGVLSEIKKGRFNPAQATKQYINYQRKAPGGVQFIDGELCVGFNHLVKIFGVVQSTVVRWRDRGCPQKENGLYSLRAVLQWRGECSVDVQSEDGVMVFKSLAEQKAYYEAELKKAQVEEREIKNAISRGDYIPKAVIVEELKRFFVVFKKSLKGFSRKVAGEISFRFGADEARQAERILSDLTDNALEQLSIDGVYDARKAAQKA